MISKCSSKSIQNILSIRRNQKNAVMMTTMHVPSTTATTSPMCTTTTTTSSYHHNHNISNSSYQSRRMITVATNKATNPYISNTINNSHHNQSTFHPNHNTHKSLGLLRVQTKSFHTESEFHQNVDDTLYTIQDTLEAYLEDNNIQLLSFEINYASGVLTISLPPHGTWVLNKQTPNEQIWWSSPISGPRRFEYYSSSSGGGDNDHVSDGKWVWTKDESVTLGQALKSEIVQLFHIDDGLEDLDDL